MTKPLKIAIATAGRFHVLDLARELHALGHEVKFYSFVPRSRARLFGLPDECHVSLLPFVSPVLGWEVLAPRISSKLRERALYFALNRAVMLRLHPCDIFHCMSGIYLEAARFARERFGAKIWLIRGSRHILSQDEILANLPGSERPSAFTIHRELAGYALADQIAIPSAHVKESFERDPVTFRKLISNPYGVDLSMFPLRSEKAPSEPFTFLTVGHWSLRKGADILQEAVKRINGARLLHVGSILDYPFPWGDPRFEHRDPVPQWQLAEVYAQADAFILASREEGFGVVITQSLAVGLPVICTNRTGGADLAHTDALAARITIVPHGNVDALAAAMIELRDRLQSGGKLPPLGEMDRHALSWAAHAVRHCNDLSQSTDQS